MELVCKSVIIACKIFVKNINWRREEKHHIHICTYGHFSFGSTKNVIYALLLLCRWKVKPLKCSSLNKESNNIACRVIKKRSNHTIGISKCCCIDKTRWKKWYNRTNRELSQLQNKYNSIIAHSFWVRVIQYEDGSIGINGICPRWDDNHTRQNNFRLVEGIS
jgi:hypothetical protein